MHRKKPFRELWVVFLGMTIPLVLLILFLQMSTVRAAEENSLSIIRSNEGTIVSSVEHTLDQMSQSARSCLTTMDFITFANSSVPNRTARYASNLTRKLRSALSSYPEAAGFVLYNTVSGKSYVTALNTGSAIDPGWFTFEGSLRTGERETSLRLVESNGKPLIAIIHRQRHAAVVLILNPEKNSFYQSYMASSELSHSLRFLPEEQLPARGVYQRFDALPLALSLEQSGGFSSLWRNSRQILIFALILLVIVMILIVGWAMQRQLIAPLRLLWQAFDRISEGDTDYRINQTTPLPEIDDFYRGFNRMLDAVQDATAARQRSELDTAHARLQYFQLQIRPHFYLNCLKNIRAMAALHEDDKIQDMVILMSDYLRYIFQDTRSFIPLQEELEAVQGYVDLCRSMGSPCTLVFDVNTDGLGDPVLPMSILTFVENSIKHNRKDRMRIQILSRPGLTPEREPYQCITIRDNGSGFAPEALETLNSADPSELHYRKEHIGIANVRYRLWLVYGSRASLSFRTEGEDAVVQVRFPAHPDDARQSIRDSSGLFPDNAKEGGILP